MILFNSFMILIIIICINLVGFTNAVVNAELNNFPKCCPENYVINKTLTNDFICTKNYYSQVQIFEISKVNKVNSRNECVEVIENVLNIFQFNGVHFTKKYNITLNNTFVVPKCCPINFFYNSSTHGCDSDANSTFFENFPNFLKSGQNKIVLNSFLKQCRIIRDKKVKFNDTQLHDGSYLLEGRKYGAGNYCLDSTAGNEAYNSVVRVCEDDLSVCQGIKCVYKCCPDGEGFINGSFCRPKFNGLDLLFSNKIASPEDEFAIIHGYNNSVILLSPKSDLHLSANGTFYLPEKGENLSYSINQSQIYCIEHATAKKKHIDNFAFFKVVKRAEADNRKFRINRILQIISVIFLLATIIIYAVTDQIKRIFGKILVAFCSVLLATFAILIYFAFGGNGVAGSSTATAAITTDAKINCKMLGFLSIYMEFCNFCWLNVMCADIYWKFGKQSKHLSQADEKTRDLKRMLKYSIYGFGCPALLLTIIAIFHNFNTILPQPIRIHLDFNCVIQKDNYAEHLFLLLPLTVMEIANLVLFVLTVKYIVRVKGMVAKMNDSSKSNKKFFGQKEQFKLIAKLSLVMGVGYLFEIVSSFYRFRSNAIAAYVEMIWDSLNCLQGVFIFIIFICKRKITNKMLDKMGWKNLRRISLISSAHTRLSHLSSAHPPPAPSSAAARSSTAKRTTSLEAKF